MILADFFLGWPNLFAHTSCFCFGKSWCHDNEPLWASGYLLQGGQSKHDGDDHVIDEVEVFYERV